MERMRGIDAGLLHMETDTNHMHTLKLALFDPGSETDGKPGVGEEVTPSLDEVKRGLVDRLSRLPGFRRRVVEVPFGLNHPVWIEDSDFDAGDHVHRKAVAAPGGRREMDAAVGEIAGTPLDRSRALWELWILDGLEGGVVGVVLKIHHAMADGMAASQIFANVLREDSADAKGPPIENGWRGETVPSRGRLIRDAVIDRLREILDLPQLLRSTWLGLRAVARRFRGIASRPPRPGLDAPKTVFNSSLTTRRSFSSAEFSLGDVKRVKDHFGVTVNDVLLALVAGSLRRYLSTHASLPETKLVAEVPVGTDSGPGSRLSGNRTSNMFTWLCTDRDDPVERLREIHRDARIAKESHELLGADLYERWSVFSPPLLHNYGMRQYAKWRLADRLDPVVNLIVSNVPGPRSSLYWHRARLRGIHSVGPILEGLGLNLTFWSYTDRVCAGALACPDRVDGLDEITGDLSRELALLVEAAESRDPQRAFA